MEAVQRRSMSYTTLIAAGQINIVCTYNALLIGVEAITLFGEI